MAGKQQKDNVTAQLDNKDKSEQTAGAETVNSQSGKNSSSNNPGFRCPYSMPLFYPPYSMGCPSDMNPQMAHPFVPFINPYMMPQCPYNIVPTCPEMSGYSPNSCSGYVTPHNQTPCPNMARNDTPDNVYPPMPPREGASLYELRSKCQECYDDPKALGQANGNYKSQNASNQQIAPMPQNNNFNRHAVSFGNLPQNNIQPQMTQQLPPESYYNNPQYQFNPPMTSPPMNNQMIPNAYNNNPPMTSPPMNNQMIPNAYNNNPPMTSPPMNNQMIPNAYNNNPPMTSPPMNNQMIPNAYNNNPPITSPPMNNQMIPNAYYDNPPMTSPPMNNQIIPNAYNNHSQYQGPLNITEPAIEPMKSCCDKCGRKPMAEISEPVPQNFENIPYSCVEDRFKAPNYQPHSSNVENNDSPCAKCCSKTPTEEEISSSKSNSNNDSNNSATYSNQSEESEKSQVESEETSNANQCSQYCQNACAIAKLEAEAAEEAEETENTNEDKNTTNPDLSFNPMANSTGNQSMFSTAGPCGHCQRAPTNYIRNSMDGQRYNKYQYNDSFNPFGTMQGNGYNTSMPSMPNNSGRFSLNTSDQMRSNNMNGMVNTGNGKCDCIYPPSMADHKCCGKTYGNCQCVSKQN